MNQPELFRRVVQYRFSGWLATAVVLGLLLAIKFIAG